MREVTVDGKGLSDSESLHDDEAQAVDGAVFLVPVPLEVLESFVLILGRGSVDPRQAFVIETFAHLDRRSMVK
jgi:hypothetical protein